MYPALPCNIDWECDFVYRFRMRLVHQWNVPSVLWHVTDDAHVRELVYIIFTQIES